MDTTPCDFDSVVEFIGRRIIGEEESAPDTRKALLALYIINIITAYNTQCNDYYQTIGDDNVFKELLNDRELLNNSLNYFVSREYRKLGDILTEFLILTARKFVVYVDSMRAVEN